MKMRTMMTRREQRKGSRGCLVLAQGCLVGMGAACGALKVPRPMRSGIGNARNTRNASAVVKLGAWG